MTPFLTVAIEAARDAGRFLKANVGNIKSIQLKQGQEKNLVTEIDRGSEAIIIDRIKQAFPDHDILAEESGSERGQQSDYRWVIDPLDGTTNYTHAFPVFSVSIGLEHRGTIVAGVVYDPSFDEAFHAERGGGAFLNGEPIHVSRIDTLSRSMVVTGFPYNIAENPDHAVEHFINFLMRTQAVRRMGSAAIDLAYVAAGRLDAFWEVALNPWDMAAGVLLVREAGGTVTGFRGETFSIYRKQILATNGLVHEEMKNVLASPLEGAWAALAQR